jgi:hypothetical protein
VRSGLGNNPKANVSIESSKAFHAKHAKGIRKARKEFRPDATFAVFALHSFAVFARNNHKPFATWKQKARSG